MWQLFFSAANAQKAILPSQVVAKVKAVQRKKSENKNKGGWVRLQPSMGIGFIAAPKTDIVTKTDGSLTAYEYRAGNWNTAFLTGMGFEFGRNNQRLMNVSINYFKGIGNMNKQTVSNESGIKTTYATLESNASGWNMRVGIPFTLAEKKPGKQKMQPKLKKQAAAKKQELNINIAAECN